MAQRRESEMGIFAVRNAPTDTGRLRLSTRSFARFKVWRRRHRPVALGRIARSWSPAKIDEIFLTGHFSQRISRVFLGDHSEELSLSRVKRSDKTANLLVAERERSPDPLEYDPTTIMEQELAFDGDLISYVLMVADVDTYKAAAMAAIASAKKKKDEPKSPPAEAEAGAAAGSPSPEGRS